MADYRRAQRPILSRTDAGGPQGSAFVLRSVVTLPVSVFMQRNGVRFELDAKPHLETARQALAEQLRAQLRRKGADYAEFQRVFTAQWRPTMSAILKQHHVMNPSLAILAPLVQIPLWILLSLSLRRCVVRFFFFGLGFVTPFFSSSFFFLLGSIE